MLINLHKAENYLHVEMTNKSFCYLLIRSENLCIVHLLLHAKGNIDIDKIKPCDIVKATSHQTIWFVLRKCFFVAPNLLLQVFKMNDKSEMQAKFIENQNES